MDWSGLREREKGKEKERRCVAVTEGRGWLRLRFCFPRCERVAGFLFSQVLEWILAGIGGLRVVRVQHLVFLFSVCFSQSLRGESGGLRGTVVAAFMVRDEIAGPAAAYGSLAYLVYDNVTRKERKKEDKTQWYVLEPSAVQLLLTLPAALGAGNLLGLTPVLQKWWNRQRAKGDLLWRTYKAQLALYYGLGGALTLMSLYRWPRFMHDRRVEKGPKSEQGRPPLPRLALFLSLNTLGPLFLRVVVKLFSNRKRVNDSEVGQLSWPVNQFMHASAKLPTMWTIIKDHLVFQAIFEVLFYLSHRLLHTPTLCK